MAKVRVYELAKELGVDSSTLLFLLKGLGEFVRSASSTIEPPTVERVRAEFVPEKSVDAPRVSSLVTPVKDPPRIQPAAKLRLPAQPQRRRVILVVTRQLVEASSPVGIDSSGGDEVAILLAPSSRPTAKSAELDRGLFDNGLLHAGATLVQSPFNANVYERAEDAAEVFMQQKFLLFTKFCQILGAKSVKLEQVVILEGDTERTLTSGIKHPVAKGEVEYRKTSDDKLRSLLELGSTFAGTTAIDLVGARELLQRERLTGDQHMTHLLDLRTTENLVIEHHLQINLTRESNHNLVVAARASGWLGLEANADWKGRAHDKTDVRLDVRVTF